MFENVVVDGSSSCIPGQYTDDADNEGFEPDADGHDESPMSVDTRKRSGSTGTCATSPVKKTKSPMVKIMKNIWASNLPKIHFLVIS